MGESADVVSKVTMHFAASLGSAWTVFALAALALCVALAYLELRRLRSGSVRWLLLSLRCAACAVVIFALLQPELRFQRTAPTIKPLAILIDTSRSMSLPFSDTRLTRLEAVKKFFAANARLVDELESKFHIRYFAFDEDISEMGRKDLSGLNADGHETQLLRAIRKVVELIGGQKPEAVLLFSDGRDTTIQDVESLKLSFDVPVHALMVGGEGKWKDVAISNVSYDAFAFVRSRWSALVTVTVRGYAGGTIPLTLKQGDRIILSRSVKFPKGEIQRKVRIEFVPDRVGDFIYTLSVPAYAGELTHENNVFNFSVSVIRDKIRVLQICGRPSYDERFLRMTLKSNPNIDLVSLFILRTRESLSLASPEEMSLIPFPINVFRLSELRTFDVVIFQNFNFLPYGVAPWLSAIRDYVRENRGGFVMIGGDLSFSRGGYAATPVASVLPVELPPVGNDLSTERFRAEPTDAGLRHPITAFSPEREECRRIWREMPELIGFNRTRVSGSGGVVLLRDAASGMPILAVRQVGTGRTMALTTDSCWRWSLVAIGEGKTNRYYHLFWQNAIRWLIQDPSLERTKIVLERKMFRPDEEFSIEVRAMDESYSPLADVGFEVTIRNVEGGKNAVEQDIKTDAGGRARMTARLSKVGVYRISVVPVGKGSAEPAEEIIAVEESDEEMRDPTPNIALLKKICEQTGGRAIFLPAADLDSVVNVDAARETRVLEQKIVSIWDNFATIIVLLAALGGEWYLRRLNGLQ